MDKTTLIGTLERMALLNEIKGENPFKIKAFAKAAQVLDEHPIAPSELVAGGTLRDLPGIGSGLAALITELVETGRSNEFETLKRQVPVGLLELLKLPNLGPRKIKALYDGLGISSLSDLERAVSEGRLADLAGFGLKTQEKIRAAIATLNHRRGLHRYAEVQEAAEACCEALRSLPGVQKVAIAGALRRKAEIVSEIALVVALESPEILDDLSKLPTFMGLQRLTPHHAMSRLPGEIEMHVHLATLATFETRLLKLTGSAEHWQQLVHRAADRKLRLDEQGLWKEELILANDEASIYRVLDLPVIPPELREGERSLEDPVPVLLEAEDLQGLFHVHTTYSDGKGTIEEMARAARDLGYRYLGITDHSPAAFYAQGLTIERLAQQQAEIDRINAELEGIRLFKGTEADILADGSVDYPPEVLARFDFVVASVHSRFGMASDEMTERIVRAIRHPFVTMLGHPTGRLLLEREPYGLDLDRIFREAAAHRVAIEINANPHRLDLDWRYLPRAIELGVTLVINPDAHAVSGLRDVRYGVGVARKGGVSALNVLNTLSLPQIEAYLQERRDRAHSKRESSH